MDANKREFSSKKILASICVYSRLIRPELSLNQRSSASLRSAYFWNLRIKGFFFGVKPTSVGRLW
jgi:hypothetical protein